ncbi:MAG TPA: cytochrome c maturation protein CcmE [Sphingomonadales bacterium]|nr:cytochrome c maturation protein CcmE [Sphingomonadales bacterium]
MTRRSLSSPPARRRNRVLALTAMVGFLALAAFLALRGFEENVVYFVTPSELSSRAPAPGQLLRLGGLVEEGSIAREEGVLVTRFAVTDGGASVSVQYEGILPDLFREGQGVIAEGAFDAGGVFIASRVLAKHDEKYMPPEVAEALKERGLWQEEADGKP